MHIEQSQIVEVAASLFSARGVKTTTMDDIARHCSTSKKILYQFFPNKEMLVMSIVQSIISKNEQIIRVSPVISANAVSELAHFFKYIETRLDILTPRLLRDVRNYYHDAFSLLLHSKDDKLIPFLKQNIIRGIAEDIYRSDLDSNAASWLYCWELQNAMEGTLVQDAKRHELLSCINSFFLHGIINAKGGKLLMIKSK